MIAIDTNVLIGAIQTFDPQVRATARHAVKSLFRQVKNFCASRKISWNFGTPRRDRPLPMVWDSLPSRPLDTWIAFRRYCDSSRRHRRFSQLGGSLSLSIESQGFRSTILESLLQ